MHWDFYRSCKCWLCNDRLLSRNRVIGKTDKRVENVLRSVPAPYTHIKHLLNLSAIQRNGSKRTYESLLRQDKHKIHKTKLKPYLIQDAVQFQPYCEKVVKVVL